jgi:hypothetical protein
MRKCTLLDEQLEWPLEQWQRGGPWRLGHGLTVVGPGWWSLVRRGFAAVAEMPGAEVLGVRQKCGVLELNLYHEDRPHRDSLRAIATACTEASRARCEGCGAGVPRLEPGSAVWRLHCSECDALIAAAADHRAERFLWERRAGLEWPSTELW